jgi:hypothetical protein
VLQETVDTAARLGRCALAALGVLDRAGSRLERFITSGCANGPQPSTERSTSSRNPGTGTRLTVEIPL